MKLAPDRPAMTKEERLTLARLRKLARTVIRARKAKSLTQRELAKLVGVEFGTVAGWETARHGIRPGRLHKVSEVLEVSVAELVP